MSSDSHFGIPIIELPTNSKDLDGGSDEWRSLCKSVREACENHGCFQVTKKQNIKSKPLQGNYEPGGDFLPFYESFGFEDASNCNSSKIHRHNHFCALLCEDGISGLEIETNDGDWVKNEYRYSLGTFAVPVEVPKHFQGFRFHGLRPLRKRRGVHCYSTQKLFLYAALPRN
ncbi:hypothetical protein GOBAR_AA28346 [Gossypium barbadense]|uniref:Non-haem dioxygenase N-terminal domain-containing protein n=1 Tax=Gossypium barbadense TaxID=3634 RepID=A0A2P5WMK4_GOSBA|nr:hypothetical protein GOBAR_AA28346 [Gossypium barbadense]